MAVLSAPLDPYNRPPEELAGYSSTSVDDGGELSAPNRPADQFRVSLIADAAETTILEEFPSAETDLGDEAHYLIDFGRAEGVYLSGAILDDDGSAGQLRLKYFRTSDSSWRYLDGAAGPALSVAVVGDIEGQIVRLEEDAKAKVWCKLVCVGGADTESPEIGDLAVHAGPMPPIVGDLFDYNPTEGSGTVITDKRGLAADMSTNGDWVALTDALKYENTGIFNFKFGVAFDDQFVLAPTSSMLIYFKAPSSFVVGSSSGYLCSRKPGPGGWVSDHSITVDLAGKINATVHVHSGAVPANTDVAVQSSTVIAANGEYVIGITHDGTTLSLYVNNVVEDTAAAGESETPAAGRYLVVGGGHTPFAVETPIEDEVLGRFIVANRALTADDMTALYAEFKAQYPGLP